MAIGKGSMARAAKVAKPVEEKAVEVKAEVKVEKKAAPVAKKAAPAAKKAPAKKPAAKKTSVEKASVVTPTAQVMDMIVKDRVEVGDEMPIYFY